MIPYSFKDILILAEKNNDTIFLSGGTIRPETSYEFPDIIKEDMKTLLFYPDTMGDIELREMYLQILGNSFNQITSKNILITAGASAAIWGALKAVTKPGDEVLILSPCWGLYIDIINNCNAIPITIDTSAVHNWQHPISCIESNISPRTRAILYADPSNPICKVSDSSWRKDLIQLSKKYSFQIITDETYSGMLYNNLQNETICEEDSTLESTIIIRSLSKLYTMPGLRIGFCISNNKMIEKIHKILVGSYLAVSSFSQMYAKKIISKKIDRSMITESYDNYLEIKNMLNENKIMCELVEPDSAFFVFIKFYNKNRPMNSFELYERTSVLCRPGNLFGNKYIRYSRICLSVERKYFKEALARIQAVL